MVLLNVFKISENQNMNKFTITGDNRARYIPIYACGLILTYNGLT